MKYQALRLQVFSVGGLGVVSGGVGVRGWGGWWWVGVGVSGVLVRDVVGGRGRVGGGMDDGVLSGW